MCCTNGDGYTAYAGATTGSGKDTKAVCRNMRCKRSC